MESDGQKLSPARVFATKVLFTAAACSFKGGAVGGALTGVLFMLEAMLLNWIARMRDYPPVVASIDWPPPPHATSTIFGEPFLPALVFFLFWIGVYGAILGSMAAIVIGLPSGIVLFRAQPQRNWLALSMLLGGGIGLTVITIMTASYIIPVSAEEYVETSVLVLLFFNGTVGGVIGGAVAGKEFTRVWKVYSPRDGAYLKR